MILWFEIVDNHSDRNFTLKVSFSLTFLLFTRFCSIYDTNLATQRCSENLLVVLRKFRFLLLLFFHPTGGVWGQVTDHESQHFLVFFDLQVVVYLLGVCVLIIMQCGTNQRGRTSLENWVSLLAGWSGVVSVQLSNSDAVFSAISCSINTIILKNFNRSHVSNR